jgi:hypothetical protein
MKLRGGYVGYAKVRGSADNLLKPAPQNAERVYKRSFPLWMIWGTALSSSGVQFPRVGLCAKEDSNELCHGLPVRLLD